MLPYEEPLLRAIQKAHIDEKEYAEAKAFYLAVQDVFSALSSGDNLDNLDNLGDLDNLGKLNNSDNLDTLGNLNNLGTIIDVCSGNGMNGFFWLLQSAAENAIFVDPFHNSNFYALEEIFGRFDKELKQRYSYVPQKIEEYAYESTDSTLVTAIHACGSLTDRVIEFALEHKFPFAVMPCCYGYAKEFLPLDKKILDSFPHKDECIDTARIMKVQAQDYAVYVRTISSKITQMNRIIIGIP